MPARARLPGRNRAMRRHPESPPRMVAGGGADRPSRSSSRIGPAEVDRPVQFILQVALAALWESWGIVPSGSSAMASVKSRRHTLDRNLSLEDAARIAAEPKQETSRFSTTVAELANEGFDVFLEIGPHPVLASQSKPPRLTNGIVAYSRITPTRRCRTGEHAMVFGLSLCQRIRFGVVTGLATWPFRSPAELSLAARRFWVDDDGTATTGRNFSRSGAQ